MNLRSLAIAALLVLGLAACSGGGSTTGDPDTVTLRGTSFRPAELTVDPGTTVTWEWDGPMDHDVAGDDFASDVQSEGTFTHTFDEPGSYPYECTLHPNMTGTVTVVDP